MALLLLHRGFAIVVNHPSSSLFSTNSYIKRETKTVCKNTTQRNYIIFNETLNSFLTGPLSYRNQSIDLLSKSMDWFLYDNSLRHERVNFSLNLDNDKTQISQKVHHSLTGKHCLEICTTRSQNHFMCQKS